MAIFNPDVKDESPQSFIGLSRPASDLRMVSGSGVALKGIGDMIETAAKGTDQVITAMAQNAGENMARTERDAYTAALEAGQKYSSGELTPQQKQQVDNSLFGDQDNPNLPQDIKSLPQKLGTLQNAKNAGKLAQTDFYGRVATLARDARSQFGSAYAPVVDQAVSNILGVDPANAYIRGIVSQMNAKAESGRNEFNYIVAAARKAYQDGDLTLKPVYEGLMGQGPLAGIDPVKAMEMVANSNYNDFRAKNAKRDQELLEIHGKNTKDLATKTFQETSFPKVLNFFNTATAVPEAMGAPPGAADRPASQQEIEARGEALAKTRQLAYTELLKKAHADGTVKAIGSEAAIKEINGMLTMFDTAIELNYNDKYGDVGRITRQLNAIRQNTDLSLLNDPDMSVFFRLYQSMNKMGPDLFTNFIKQSAASGELIPKMQAFMARQKALIATNSDVKGNPNPTGSPATFNGAFDHFERDGVGSPQNIDDLLSLIYGGKSGGKDTGGLLDPKAPDETKRNLAVAMFHPRNLGFISRLNQDQQVNFFNKLTSVDVQKEVLRLSAKDPSLAPMMYSWIKTTFKDEIFKKEILSLADIGDSKNLGLRWSDEDKQWALEVKDGSGKVVDPYANLSTKPTYISGNQRPGLSQGQYIVQPNSLIKARQTVNRLNQGLKSITSMYAVAGTEDQDVGKFIIQSLIGLDYLPKTLPEGLPSQIADSIIAARKKAADQKAKKDLGK